jgi:hypothetical protein
VQELGAVDVIKLNIEGMEFEVLEAIIANDLLRMFKHIQVQFHGILKDGKPRRDAILAALSQTHDSTFCTPWRWEGFTRK